MHPASFLDRRFFFLRRVSLACIALVPPSTSQTRSQSKERTVNRESSQASQQVDWTDWSFLRVSFGRLNTRACQPASDRARTVLRNRQRKRGRTNNTANGAETVNSRDALKRQIERTIKGLKKELLKHHKILYRQFFCVRNHKSQG